MFRRNRSSRSRHSDEELINDLNINKDNNKTILSRESNWNTQQLANWKPPTTPISTIYKKGILDFKAARAIKIKEKVVPLYSENQSMSLLSKKTILKYINQGYRFMHIGLVQIAIKPLTVEGLNTSMHVALRDCRHINYKDSLLGLFETSLTNGPIYSNCFPNFTVSLTDPHIMKILTLDILTLNYNMLKGSHIYEIFYRLNYKIRNTGLCPNAIDHNRLTGETIFWEIDQTKANITVPKTIQWKDVSLPETWKYPVKTIPNLPPKENKEIENEDGSVELKFKGQTLLDKPILIYTNPLDIP